MNLSQPFVVLETDYCGGHKHYEPLVGQPPMPSPL
ncbi:hypothetical protein TGAMA5MH_04093 [Trichoderma gamsii]|uniref:Uncharacterized protein n=1 Tax=Trichoderma gamsii TaxID=398673 RepID=A0A2K0TE55_9HYPO|nr:hypothetical protein TGAMA5MH_04093 [Trichoderma gamsii]